MDNKLSVEIGARCKKFRVIRGLTQQQLADKIGTTAQNISKYEKEIHDIDVIRELSNALGYDLTSDEMDNEGKVGEIGREILMLLAEGEDPSEDELTGCMDAKKLLKGSWLYGLTEERINRELFKLLELGLCVREQYTDFYDKKQDVVFITAKGVIALKHLESVQNAFGKFKNVESYENICRGKESFQAYIDSRPSKKILAGITLKNGFRANLIHFLQRQYDVAAQCLKDLAAYFPGRSVYEDIMFSMIMDMTRERADSILETYVEWEENYYDIQDAENIVDPANDVYERFVKSLKPYIADEECAEQNIDFVEWVEEARDYVFDTEEQRERVEALNELDFRMDALLTDARLELAEIFRKKREQHAYSNPLKWYSKEEIEAFIKDNVREPKSEAEKTIVSQLMQIKENDPAVFKSYFDFPREWEANGLAQLVREQYGIN